MAANCPDLAQGFFLPLAPVSLVLHRWGLPWPIFLFHDSQLCPLKRNARRAFFARITPGPHKTNEKQLFFRCRSPGHFDRSRHLLDTLGALLGRSWVALGLSWEDLGGLLATLKRLLAALGAFLAALGSLLAALGRSWAVLGPLLGSSWVAPGRS